MLAPIQAKGGRTDPLKIRDPEFMFPRSAALIAALKEDRGTGGLKAMHAVVGDGGFSIDEQLGSIIGLQVEDVLS